jgi:hypothetical protein
MLNRLLIIVLVGFMLTGCSTVKELKIFSTEVERQPLNLPNADAPKMEELNWIIITSENAEEVFAKLKENKTDPVLFGLTDDNYESLAKNFAQIRAYIIKQNMTLDQYRKYYEADKVKKQEEPAKK